MNYGCVYTYVHIVYMRVCVHVHVPWKLPHKLLAMSVCSIDYAGDKICLKKFNLSDSGVRTPNFTNARVRVLKL